MADSKSEGKSKPTTNHPDESNLKLVSALAYLGLLFFVPMLMFPKEKFAMFHANQGLLLLITAAAVNIVGSIIPFIGWFIVLPIGNIFVLVLFVIGLINAFNGKMQRLPLIGSFDLIKVQE